MGTSSLKASKKEAGDFMISSWREASGTAPLVRTFHQVTCFLLLHSVLLFANAVATAQPLWLTSKYVCLLAASSTAMRVSNLSVILMSKYLGCAQQLLQSCQEHS